MVMTPETQYTKADIGHCHRRHHVKRTFELHQHLSLLQRKHLNVAAPTDRNSNRGQRRYQRRVTEGQRHPQR